jgi:sialate O-acetylesterase
MIAPLVPYPIAGVIWYQGEGNTYDPLVYQRLFPALIENWRTEWGQAFPFYYVQIGPFKYGTPQAAARVREAQRLSLSVPNTGMVVISDIGHSEDNHPRNKRDVGKRLADWALARTYGKDGIPFSGPLYREMKIEGNQIRVLFDFAENGLLCKGERLSDFQIAGEDRVFVEAEARIDGHSVIVSAREVRNPVAVRFAWADTAEPNLFNAEGLPASCFRTDNWNIDGQ